MSDARAVSDGGDVGDAGGVRDERPGSTTPWRRDPAALEAGLGAWARSWRGERAVVSDVLAPDSGMANDTVLFRLDGERLVARLAPAPESPYPTFPTYDFELQRRVIEVVRERTTVPVPEVVRLESSPEWLGVSFLVTRAVDGVVASDNPPYLLDPRTTAATYERLSGGPLDDLAWYEALAGLRFGIILARMTLRSAAFGVQPLPDDPDEMIMFASLLEQLLGEV